MALTVKAIEKLKPDPAKRREVPDGTVGGLYLVIQVSGEKSWAVRYRHGGKPRKLTLGPLYKPDPHDKEAKAPAPVLGRPLDLKGARMLAGRALDAVASGRDPGVEKIAAKRLVATGATDRDRFGTVAIQFIQRYSKPKNKSWREQAWYLGLKPDRADPDKLVTIPGGVAERWGHRVLSDIRKRDIIDELDARVDHAPIAANRWLAHTKKLFGWAVSRDLIEVSPCAGVARPVPERSRDRILSDSELRLVWLAADRVGFPIGDMIKMLALTGGRRSEVAGLVWQELDLDKALWSLPGERTKNKRPHVVPLSSAALEVIAALPRFTGARFLFTHNSGASPVAGHVLAKQAVDRAMSAIAAEQGATAEIASWVIHDLRRTMVSGMARLGVALPTIEKCVNHTSGSFAGIVSVYQRHDYQAEMRSAFEVWGRFVTSLVEGQPGNVVSLQAAR